MARWFVNPKKDHRSRPRVTVRGRTFTLGKRSPWKRKVHRVNPHYLTELGMLANRKHHKKHHHYRHNPGASLTGGVMKLVKNPLPFVTDGAAGIVGAYVAVTLPTMFLPANFNGADLMSKVVRALARAVTGMGVYMAAKKLMPRYAHAVLAGAAVGTGGALVLDLLGTRLILGAGDNQQHVMGLFSGVGLSGLGAYTRSPQVGAYTRAPALSGYSIYGRNSYPS